MYIETQLKLETAVDYLTVTTKSESTSANLIHKLFSLKPQEFWTSARHKRWSFMGYVGQAYEGIRYGLRKSEAIVMLSGPTCQELWSKVAPLRARCSRIDLAVTVTLPARDKDVARNGYKQALDFAGASSALVTSSRGGNTLYSGSRSSRFFGRLYDKGAEEGLEPGAIWRYEVECKKPASEAMVSALLESVDVPVFIGDYVYQWFASRGVQPIWTSKDTQCAIELSAYVQTPDKSLEWLRTQVKPTIARLVIAGREQEVRDALGLPNQIDSVQKEKGVKNGY